MTTAQQIRLPGWEELLARHLASQGKTPFAWGTHDCCSMAAGAVLVTTGRDPMQALRGRYTSQAGAARLIQRAGGMVAIVCKYMGDPLQHTAMAGRGDVVLLPDLDGNGSPLGICWGDIAFAAGRHGQVTFPRGAAVAAWKV